VATVPHATESRDASDIEESIFGKEEEGWKRGSADVDMGIRNE